MSNVRGESDVGVFTPGQGTVREPRLPTSGELRDILARAKQRERMVVTADVHAPTGERFDIVKRPKHYNTGSIEVWDFIADQKMGYLDGNVVKYVARYRHKGRPLEDLKKAQAYLNKLIDQVEQEQAAAVSGEDVETESVVAKPSDEVDAVRGITFDRNRGKWQAFSHARPGTRKYVGRFATREEAIEAVAKHDLALASEMP